MYIKLVRWLTGIACIGLLFPVVAIAEGSWLINRSHTVFTITKEGEVHVLETVTVDFADSRKTGVQRHIPLKYSVDDKIWFAKVTDLTVQRNQVDETFSLGGDDTQLVVKVGDERLDLTGQQTYTFAYTVTGALRHSVKSDYLYLQATGGWETTIEQATAIIKLPADGIEGQQCEVLPVSEDYKQGCQSVGLNKSESRFAALDSLRPYASMYAQADYRRNLVPIETVQPPSLIDWIEVYQQPLLILSAVSTVSLLTAGILWLKARKIRNLEHSNSPK